jgi:rubrerythrin
VFDDLLGELKELERGISVRVEIPLDEKGYMDRRCPSDECAATFKVLYEDWRDKVRDEAMYCALCRHEAPSTEWNTEEQIEHIKSVGQRHMIERTQKAMRDGAQKFNARQPKEGFISLSLSVKPGQLPVVVPVAAAEALRQDFVCESCGCRYSSVGAAFFCPACGHNSAISTFETAVNTVIAAVEGLPALRQFLEERGDPDTAANICRDVLESRLEKLVASFQRFAEVTYARLPEPKPMPKKNAFQRLQESSELWRAVGGKGYDEVLAPHEMADLVRLFQQRHLLAHREGIVDEEYLKKSGDLSYEVGQRIVVREEPVLRLAVLLRKLAAAILLW